MEIKQLKYFVEVVRNNSFTRAAERLFVTQPLLTRTIQQLEEELGVKLIQRTSKTFYLTDAGQVLFDHGQALFVHYDDVIQAVDDVRLATTGNVRMSIPGILLDFYFPDFFAQFRKKFPGIDISVVEEGSKPAASSVESGLADLGLVMLPVEKPGRFTINLLIKSTCQLVVHQSHPFAKQEVVRISDLKDETILTFSETATLHDIFIKMCEEHGFVPHIAYKSLMNQFDHEMIARNLCVAVLPLPFVQHDRYPELVSVPLEPEIPWEIAIIRRSSGYFSFAAARFFECISEYFSTLRYR